MKAMVLAAGLGTRLRPLTDDRPKALVEVAGRTLLEIALNRLRSFGVREVIVNVHHYADSIIEYLETHQNFGMHVEVSREQTLLDTGGGLKQAAHFFLGSTGNAQEPFLVHNVDVISNIDLAAMADFHSKSGALATLAVQNRRASRYLLFNEGGQLVGRRSAPLAIDSALPSANNLNEEALAFCGIHLIAPRLFSKMQEEGTFSIIDAYIRLALAGEKIVAYRTDGSYWRDLGRPESIAQATLDIEAGLIA